MCDQCIAATINGQVCHEHGCPNAWKEPRKCTYCGEWFTPSNKHNKCCYDCSLSDEDDVLEVLEKLISLYFPKS